MSEDSRLWYTLSRIALPIEEYGECRSVKHCKSYQAVLGNGYCCDCWDRGAGTVSDMKKKKKSKKKEKVAYAARNTATPIGDRADRYQPGKRGARASVFRR